MKTRYNKFLLGLMIGVPLAFNNAAATSLDIANSPLFLLSSAHPNILIDLSIESPMIGAAYNDQNDGGSCTGRPDNEDGYAIGTCYFKTNTYIGYFDPDKCYSYASNRFESAGAVINSNHECSSQWSGNFLNWATMSAIDEFRMALTGGHRSSDTATLTVLQRANQTLGRGHSWFPLKKIGRRIRPGRVDPRTVTPYTDSTIYIYNHGTQFDIGTSTATTTATFNARVKVCDSAAGLETNCEAFDTSYKPVGIIQNNADDMRFAVTSYLLDSNQARGGGVLRSKMKYAGPFKYASGVKSDNPNTEWSSTDGTLIDNPDPTDASASGVSNSGIINYINKFGANGYKSYDPAGELFYEALRYYKHLSPTPEYSSDLTSAMKDGFPVITRWDDPVQFFCQKNFIVGINDANPWLDKKLPGTAFMNSTLANGTALIGNDYGQPSNPDTAINVRTLTNTVGDLEGLTNTSRCIGGNTNTYNGTASNKTITALGEMLGTCPYPPKQNSYYIAGLAYYANTNDIRSDFDDKQSVATYMIDTQEYSTTPLTGNMNMLWLAAKYGGFVDSNDNDRPDLAGEWDSNTDGEPDNYVLASKPEKLVSGLDNAFKNILEKNGSSAAALAASSTSIQTGTVLYQAQFNSKNWSGHFYNFTVQSDGSVTDVNADGKLNGIDANWDAAMHIPAATATPAADQPSDLRHIFTYNGSAGSVFAWANLTTAQQTALKTTDADTLGPDRVDWLRGVNTKEQRFSGGIFRNRTDTVLGDIINSDPMYSFTEDYGFSKLPESTPEHASSPSYATFVSGKSSRVPMVYVGANDGMLHAFRAATNQHGAEEFAYIPAGVYDNLRLLTDTAYAHKYFVDGAPNVSDAYFSNTWKTVLVGGLGGGGKSIYALDISNPTTFSESNVLWEYTGGATDTGSTGVTDAEGMGLTYSQPQIARLNDGSWAAIFGNGYNSTGERAFLYIVNLSSGALITRIPTDTATGNGLSTPILYDDPNNSGGTPDKIIDTVYAGDLQGRLWKFDLSASNTASWGLGNGGSPLFTARNDNNEVQPITAPPVVGGHPNGGVLVYFGTGSYLTIGDITNTNVETFYAIWDDPDATGTVLRADLQAQTITLETSQFGFSLRETSENTVSWGDKRGWYLDLVPPGGSGGERVISSALLKYDRVIFVTVIPSIDPCLPGGDSWLMELDMITGRATEISSFDFNDDDKFDDQDQLESGNTASGLKSTVGIVKAPVWLDKEGSGHAYKEMSGTDGNIMGPKNRGPLSGGTGAQPIREYWLQIQ